MSEFQHDSALQRTFKALEKDLFREGGPQISTTRNYNFAIVPYEPAEEFAIRQHVNALSEKLRQESWTVAAIALHT